MRGTLSTITSARASTQAASTGRASFLLPAGVTVPRRGWPPSTRNRSPVTPASSPRTIITDPIFSGDGPGRRRRGRCIICPHERALLHPRRPRLSLPRLPRDPVPLHLARGAEPRGLRHVDHALEAAAREHARLLR